VTNSQSTIKQSISDLLTSDNKQCIANFFHRRRRPTAASGGHCC
jgi:hypothetical protein